MTKDLEQTERALNKLTGELYDTANVLVDRLATGQEKVRPEVMQSLASAAVARIFLAAVRREMKKGR